MICLINSNTFSVDLLASAKDDISRGTSLISDMDNLEKTIMTVQEMLERVTDYVNKVLASIIYVIISF